MIIFLEGLRFSTYFKPKTCVMNLLVPKKKDSDHH